jgi:transposase-like protein
MRISIKVPKVKSIPEGYVSHCPYCNSFDLVRHGKRLREVKDPKVENAAVQRWKCNSCNRTFTQRPEGISRSLFSNFVISLSVFLYTLGLSYNSVSKALIFFDIFIDPSTVWRHFQEIGKKLRNRPKNRHSIAGFDQTYMKVKGIKEIVNMVFSTDEVILDVEILPNETSKTFKKKVEKLKEELGLEVLVTDDHASYRDGFIDTDVERQSCLVHVLKNISKALKKLDFTLEEKEVIMKLTRAPTKEGINIIWGMYVKRLKERGSRDEGTQFLLRLTEKWRDLTTYERKREVPKENNFTERSIGRTKIRYKTTRGMKSREGLLNFIYVTQEIWRDNAKGEIDLKSLIA